MTLHLLLLDKFTGSFYHYITHVIKLQNHQFVFISDEKGCIKKTDNLFTLQRPLSRNLFCNAKLLFRLCKSADRIILHGDVMVHFFTIFPFFLRKAGWVIYGQELYTLGQSGSWTERFKKFVLGRVQYHITHIKGDSELSNKLLSSNAQFVYSPMYLSNVADTENFHPDKLSAKAKLKVLVGNSTDPTNNHEGIFKKILPFLSDIETVYCPLSYGMYDDYKEKVIKMGKEMIGDKFVVMEKFMPFEEYKQFLSVIDVVIFDHNRQEAMGVTITLMSLGKTVYVNPNTTSYESLTRRGFKIFDNNLIDTEGLKTDRDVSQNVACLQKYYSKKVFDKSWTNISQL